MTLLLKVRLRQDGFSPRLPQSGQIENSSRCDFQQSDFRHLPGPARRSDY
jgi:hypothetical protein